MFKRPQYQTLIERLEEPRRFIQVLAGPRQVGKTTIAHQVADSFKAPIHFVSADEPTLRSATWIQQQWEVGRSLAAKNKALGAVIIIDEVQKAPSWSETIKRLWDEDTRKKTHLKVVLLGSAPLLLQRGLTESLAGRFEIIPVNHWVYNEMREAFGWTLQQYIYYGGYPGAAMLIDDHNRWVHYIKDSLIETTVSRDIFLMSRVDKPALLRQLFHLGCAYSGQIVSYQKMVGQLQDAGNTTTLAHYLRLLSNAGMLAGLEKFSGRQIRQRASSPKFIVLNTALISAQSGLNFEEATKHRDEWGRLAESCVGAYLLNSSVGTSANILYWREGNKEVDFVIQDGKKLTAIEVKTGRKKESIVGIESFAKLYRQSRTLLVGEDGISLDEFLTAPITKWIG